MNTGAAMNTVDEQTYTITELSREFGVTARTIRFYEDQRLLQPLRSGRKRVYSKEDRTRLKLVLRGRRLGLTLAEIRDLVQMYDDARNSPPLLERFLAMLTARRAAMEERRQDIEAVLQEIDSLEVRCRELLRKIVASDD